LEKARLELAKLKEAKRTGEGPRSLTEKKAIIEEQRKAAKEAALAQASALITVASFWKNHYWPTQAHKSVGGRAVERGLWSTWLCPRIGEISIVSLSPAHLEAVKIDMMNAGKSPATIRYARTW